MNIGSRHRPTKSRYIQGGSVGRKNNGQKKNVQFLIFEKIGITISDTEPGAAKQRFNPAPPIESI